MSARSMVVVGLAGVVAAVVLLAFVVWIVGSGDKKVDVWLGDDTFADLDANRTASRIASSGPVLFSDVSGNRTRDIYVQHLGDDPKQGWLAFDARRPGAERKCYVEWKAAERHFVDRCDGAIFAADGAGLTQYAASVNDAAKVVINLNQVGPSVPASSR